MLSWTKLNPTVNLKSTTKKFYNKFLYKVKIFCPGSRMILLDNIDLVKERFKSRMEDVPSLRVYYNYGGSWAINRIEHFRDNAKLNQILYFHSVKETYKNKLSFRVEEPNLTIYSNDEQLLYDICEKTDSLRLEEVYGPENDECISILDKNEIILYKDNGYKFKVYLKDKWFPNAQEKHNLLDHLYNLDDEIKLPKSFIKLLGDNKVILFTGGYLYAKNESTISFLNLIMTDLIAGIYKLTVIKK